MRFKSAALAISLSLLCLAPKMSFATTLTLKSTDSGIYPYAFSIDGSSTYVNLSCLNDTRTVQVGESWSVNVTNLGTLGASGSIDGSSYIALREDAYLDALYNTGFMGATNAEIQAAIWDILDPSDYSSLDSKSKALIADAVGAQAGLSTQFLSQFTLYTPVVPNGDSDPLSHYNWQNPSNWDHNGEPQQFMGYTPAPTPEPSSLILLGTGLMGAVTAMRRRIAATA